MAKTSQNYWLKRQTERLAYAESIGNDAILNSLALYESAQKNIEKDLKQLYKNFAGATGLTPSTLNQVLSGPEKKQFITQVQKKMDQFGIDANSVYAERYIMRISRLEALQQQIYWEVAAIAPTEQEVTGFAYREMTEESYKSFHDDFREAGFGSPFSTLNTGVANALINTNWLGSNYSERIWGHVSNLAQELPRILGGGLISGQSYQKTAKILADRFDVTKYEATRLVRTESNFFYGQAEIQSYKDDGILNYIYTAHLDNRTSQICTELNGQIFALTDAQAGINYPPMHPNCRSTTLPDLDSIVDPQSVPFESNVPPVYPEGQTVDEVIANVPQSGSIVASNTEFTELFPKNSVQVTGNVKDSVEYYTEEGYRRINNELRSGTVSKYIESQVENLDSAFSDQYLKGDFFAYRGVDLTNLGDSFTPGTRVKDNGYMSFSFNLAEANQFSGEVGGENAGIIEVIVPKETKVLIPYMVSDTRSMEQELLLPRGTELEIIEKEDNYIRAKLVPKTNE